MQTEIGCEALDESSRGIYRPYKLPYKEPVKSPHVATDASTLRLERISRLQGEPVSSHYQKIDFIFYLC
jgi:hypothetical protein